MADMIRTGEPVMDDSAAADAMWRKSGFGGQRPRDYDAMPARPYGAVEMPLLSMEEIKGRAERMAADESRLSDIYLRRGWENLDQGQDGYCWMYGGGHALMLLRDVQNQPLVRISAHCPAAIVKNGRNEGGWGALGMDKLMSFGAPDDSLWPTHSTDLRNVTDAVKASAAKYRIAEGWFDAAAPAWDRDLSFQQTLTLLACRVPVVADFNHWGHCVCLLDPVVMPDGSMGVRLINSWKNWGMRGLGILSGSKARPDNAVAPRVVLAT